MATKSSKFTWDQSDDLTFGKVEDNPDHPHKIASDAESLMKDIAALQREATKLLPKVYKKKAEHEAATQASMLEASQTTNQEGEDDPYVLNELEQLSDQALQLTLNNQQLQRELEDLLTENQSRGEATANAATLNSRVERLQAQVQSLRQRTTTIKQLFESLTPTSMLESLTSTSMLKEIT